MSGKGAIPASRTEEATEMLPPPVGELRGRLLVGRYYIIERMAVGGMAEVYLATHGQLAGFQTPVVVKRILPNLAHSREFIEMFLDEARIAALLQHPNIANIMEVGRERDEYFLAMELVQGESLSQVLRTLHAKQHQLPPALAAFIASQILAGLHHAHTICDTQGQPLHVVHRDISPQNILISYEGAVKVIDFGIARAMGRVTHTRVGSAKGKFSYMSPEQARREAVDHRSDIFSLGVVLWEMITGCRLFRRDNELDTVDAILGEAAPPLSKFIPVPPLLEAIVDRSLAKNVDERFASAQEMETLLQRYVSEEGVAGPPELRRFMHQYFLEEQNAWRQRVRRALSQTTPVPEMTPITASSLTPLTMPESPAAIAQARPRSYGMPLLAGVTVFVSLLAVILAWKALNPPPPIYAPPPSAMVVPVVTPTPSPVPPPVLEATLPRPAPTAPAPTVEAKLRDPTKMDPHRKPGKLATPAKTTTKPRVLKPNPFGF